MSRTLAIIGVLVILAGIAASQAFFVVDETQQALVLRFGEVRRTIKKPGLNVKLPFFENSVYYEKRVLDVDAPSEEMILSDQKLLVVDSYARNRIIDPLDFFKAVRTERA